MMNDQTDRSPRVVRETGAQYVVNTQGRHVAVLLPIKEYQHYLELLKREAGELKDEPATHPIPDDSQPAERLDELTGLMEIGGDALADSEALNKLSDEDEEVTRILVAAGLIRSQADRSSPPPDPVSAQERRELAEILGRAPGKPLSEIVIEERGEW